MSIGTGLPYGGSEGEKYWITTFRCFLFKRRRTGIVVDVVLFHSLFKTIRLMFGEYNKKVLRAFIKSMELLKFYGQKPLKLRYTAYREALLGVAY